MGLGVVALRRMQRRPEGGRGLALAGALLGIAWTAVLAVGLGVAIADAPERDAAGRVESGGAVSHSALRPGGCVGMVGFGRRITRVDVVPCARPHEAQVVVKRTLPAGPYPGDREIERLSEDAWTERLQAQLGDHPQADRIQVAMLWPDETSWRRDRDVACLAVAADAQKLVGPL